MLRFDPNGRVNAQEALRHEYLAERYDEEDEIVATHHVDWAFDDDPFEAGRLQCLIYREVAALHPEIVERDHDNLQKKDWLPALASLTATTPAPAEVALAPPP